SWVEITANERHPGGTYSEAGVGAGVLDSAHGRIVSIPRQVNGELYGSFLPGTQENLQRALDGLMEFLPSKAWFDRADALDGAFAD
ncbi:ESX secretion-associated protein EspG, partial [Mycobacterium sp. ITM-2017-0098]